MGTSLSIYQKVENPLQFCADMAEAFAAVICCDKRQGQAMVLQALCEGLTPMELQRRYHWIQGKPSMRADAMRAEFVMNHGGKFEVLELTPDKVAVRITDADQRTRDFSITWEQALQEPWPWKKECGPLAVDPKTGHVDPRRLEPTAANLKDNWATPRGRQNMMFARMTSEGLRAMCAQLVAGIYTPEEIRDTSDVIEREVLPAKAPLPSAAEVIAAAAGMTNASPPVVADPAPFDDGEVVNAEFEVVDDVDPRSLPDNAPGSVTSNLVYEIEELAQAVFGEDARAAIESALKARDCKVLRNLSREQANEIITRLRDKARVDASPKN